MHKGVNSLGWQLDYARFRVWLKDKYHVERAYIFIGLIPAHKNLYKYLQEAGFILVYKEVVYGRDRNPKGNCDADLVLYTVVDTYENKFDKAVIVSSDGDYSSMINFLQGKNKLFTILSPREEKNCSILLKRTGAKISYINDQKSLLESSQKEKAPNGDKTP